MFSCKPPKKSFISRIPWFVIGARVRLLIVKVVNSVLLRPVKNTYGLSAVIALRRSCVASVSIRYLHSVHSVLVICILYSNKVG